MTIYQRHFCGFAAGKIAVPIRDSKKKNDAVWLQQSAACCCSVVQTGKEELICRKQTDTSA